MSWRQTWALQAVPGDVPAADGLGAARLIVGLVVVFVALAGFLWLLRRGTFSVAGRARRPELAVESAISLGERRSLLIVSVEGRRLLLGASPAQVSLVAELAPRPAEFSAVLDSASRSARGEGRP